jgi:hypothetical protein
MSICKKCNVLRDKRKFEDRSPEYKKKAAGWSRQYRSKKTREKLIVEDNKKGDRKSGRQNDLDEVFVRELISKGCVYCGVSAEQVKMSLDRIDNKLGHTKENVTPSCLECNLTRGDMPYNAWLLVSVGMRHARGMGLLNGWTRGR